MIRTEEELVADQLSRRVAKVQDQLVHLAEDLGRYRNRIDRYASGALKPVNGLTARAPYAWTVHDLSKNITDTLACLGLSTLITDAAEADYWRNNPTEEK